MRFLRMKKKRPEMYSYLIIKARPNLVLVYTIISTLFIEGLSIYHVKNEEVILAYYNEF